MTAISISTATRTQPAPFRNPVTWLFCALAIFGGTLFGLTALEIVALYPAASVLAIVVLIGYTAAWLAVIRHHRLYGQFTRNIAVIAFFWGGAVCFEMAAIAEQGTSNVLWRLFGPGVLTSGAWEGLTAGPIEETAKVLGVLVLFALLAPRIRSPFEAMLLGAGCGLGFQIVEDFGYVAGSPAPFGVGPTVPTLVLRLATGFWSHTTFTAIAGAGIGYLLTRHGRPRIAGVALIASAIVFHTAYDSGLGNQAVPTAGRVALFLFAVLGSSAVIVTVYRNAVHRDRAWALQRLDGERRAGLVSDSDLEGMATTTVYGRRRYRRSVTAGHPRRTRHLVAQHQRALGALAAALDDADGAPAPAVDAARADVQRTREALVAAGVVAAPVDRRNVPAAPDNVAPAAPQEATPHIDPEPV